MDILGMTKNETESVHLIYIYHGKPIGHLDLGSLPRRGQHGAGLGYRN